MTKGFYGAVGNGETVALIGPSVAVEWLCAPQADSFPVYARALDPQRGGALTLSVARDGEAVMLQGRQRYLGRSNILQTEAEAGGLTVTVTDYMPWGRHHLTRRITLVNRANTPGQIEITFRSTPTNSVAAPEDLGDKVHAGFKGPAAAMLAPGEALTTTLVAAYGDTAGEAFRNWEAAAPDDLAAEERFWAGWLALARPVRSGDAALDEAYYRSLLALKLLCQERTGAILAAPTASFPAIPGGGDNWDYRYCWLRDGYFIARCLDAAGLHSESRRFYDLVLRFQESDGRWRQTLYTVDGGDPVESSPPDLTGPGGERPVRFGNAASTQVQIDSEPNVLHGLWCHWRATGDDAFIRDRWTHIRLAADAVMQTWKLKENGIWEIRERVDHWVYGKALCAAGLRAAADMALAVGAPDEAARWSAEALAVRDDVVERGWCEERQAYLQTYASQSPLDISVLALTLWDLLPAGDPRMAATVAAMEAPHRLPELPPDREYSTDTPYWGLRAGGLNMGGAMARYDYAAVPFYLPTLWLARHYLRAGNRERALALVRLCLEGATDMGLMAEHFDPVHGGQWGNFPQGFSHEEMALVLLELFGE